VALFILFGVVIWAYVARRPVSATVVRRDIVASVTADGKVVAPPEARADVRAPYRAPVAKVYSSVGDRVRAGAVLVELSYPTAQVAYEQARAAVKSAEEALAATRKTYQTSIDTAKQHLEEARATERRARAGALPAASDQAGGVSVREPAADLSQATNDRQAAEQALITAQEQRTAALAPYEQQLETARASLREAQAGRKVAMIRAPIRGTVLALNAQPGKEIGDDRTPVATIVDLGKLQVQAALKPDQASALRRDIPVSLTFKELSGQQFTGHVASITTEPGGPLQGERYVAIVAFENDRGLVKPDMNGSAAIQLGETRQALAVPSEAVDKDESARPIVHVLRGGQWQAVVVQPGLSDGRFTEIKSGLKEGETVQVTPDLVPAGLPKRG
jgi:RND family efflux transporter MFP subunit